MGLTLVIGGGISGLSAAWELIRADPQARVRVIEGSDRVGGKLRGGTVAGVGVDVGAESLLARRPEGLELIGQLGLQQDLVHPATATASIWSRGRLHPMPPRTLMGIPSDVATLRGLLTEGELARVLAEDPAGTVAGHEAGADVSIGDLVATRLGPAVLDRLVEPLLGGVYAGHARSISAAAALPALAGAHRRGESLTALAARTLPVPLDGASPAPVFAGLRGGLHRLASELADRLREHGVEVLTGVTARELRALPGGGYAVLTGPVPSPTTYRADAVVLAVPPAAAARLLSGPAPRAAALLAQVETASMAVLTLAFRAGELPALQGSGVLVPPVEGLAIKAATFSAAKWEWVRAAGANAGPDGEDLVLLRASVGRHREEAVLQAPDAALVDLALADLGTVVGAPLPAPVDALVTRWGGGLPQYAVGHAQRVASVRADVAGLDGLAVCGAALDGVGIPACIASGRLAAAQVRRGHWGHDATPRTQP